eukprot:10266068-Alexandrium_andersonii.AAC.1
MPEARLFRGRPRSAGARACVGREGAGSRPRFLEAGCGGGSQGGQPGPWTCWRTTRIGVSRRRSLLSRSASSRAEAAPLAKRR